MRIFGALLFFAGLTLIIVVAANMYIQLAINLPVGSNAGLVMAAIVSIAAGLPIAGAMLIVGGAVVEAIKSEGQATRLLLGEKVEKGDTVL